VSALDILRSYAESRSGDDELCSISYRTAREACAEIARLREALRDFRDNFDCDNNAHRHGTTCRCCTARAALETKP